MEKIGTMTLFKNEFKMIYRRLHINKIRIHENKIVGFYNKNDRGKIEFDLTKQINFTNFLIAKLDKEHKKFLNETIIIKGELISEVLVDEIYSEKKIKSSLCVVKQNNPIINNIIRDKIKEKRQSTYNKNEENLVSNKN